MARTSTRIWIARVAGASAAAAVATVVIATAPAGAATARPAALSSGACGATFEDGGAVTGIVHTFVEPLIQEPGRGQVHTLNCSLAYIGLTQGIDL